MYKYWDDDKLKEVRLKKEDVITGCFDQIKARDKIYKDVYMNGMGGSPDNLQLDTVDSVDAKYIHAKRGDSFFRTTGKNRASYIVCWQPHDGRKVTKDDTPYEI